MQNADLTEKLGTLLKIKIDFHIIKMDKKISKFVDIET